MTMRNKWWRVAATVLFFLVASAGVPIWIHDMWRSNLSRLDVIEVSVALLLLMCYTLPILYGWLWHRKDGKR